MADAGKITIFILISVVLIGLGYFAIRAFTGTGLQFGDGYTGIGSSLEYTNFIQKTNLLATSQYWNFEQNDNANAQSYTASSVGGNDQDAIIAIGGEGKSCIFLNEPLGERKIRAEIGYQLASSNLGSSSISIGVANGESISAGGIGDGWSQGIGNRVITIEDTTLVDVVPNIFNTNVKVFINGIERSSFDSSQQTYLRICVSSGGQGAGASAHIKQLRYQPLLGCEKEPNDVFVEQSFTGGQSINLDDFRYPAKSFCYSNPITFIRANNAGTLFDESSLVFSQLANGQSVAIPAGDIWRVTYTIDNSRGVIPTQCSSDQKYDLNSSSCTALVVAFQEGTLNTDTNTFTIEPKTICEQTQGIKAIWDEQKQQCIYQQPVLEFCDVNSNEPCTLRVSTICENSGMTYNSELKRCESESKINPVEQTITPKVNHKIYYIGGSIIAFLIIIIGILLFRGKKRRR